MGVWTRSHAPAALLLRGFSGPSWAGSRALGPRRVAQSARSSGGRRLNTGTKKRPYAGIVAIRASSVARLVACASPDNMDRDVIRTLCDASTMAAITFNPTLALPARTATLSKGRARAVAVRAAARPVGASPAASSRRSPSSKRRRRRRARSPRAHRAPHPHRPRHARGSPRRGFPRRVRLRAYGHYLGLVLIACSLTTEKFLIKPELTEEEAKTLVVADSVTASPASSCLHRLPPRHPVRQGLGILLHEPIFWVKMGLFAVRVPPPSSAPRRSSQMAVKQTNGEADATKLGEKLSARMQKIVNGELLALGSILAAPARGRVRRRHAVQAGAAWSAVPSPPSSTSRRPSPGPTKKRWLKRWRRDRDEGRGRVDCVIGGCVRLLWKRGGASERT